MSKDIKKAILLEYWGNKNIVNNKKELLMNVWYRFGWDDTSTLGENLGRVPMAWSIDRALRELRKEGKIKLSKEVEEERYQQYKEKTEEYGKAFDSMFGIQDELDKLTIRPKVEIDEETNTVRLL